MEVRAKAMEMVFDRLGQWPGQMLGLQCNAYDITMMI